MLDDASLAYLPLRRLSCSPDAVCVIKQHALSSDIRIQFPDLASFPEVAFCQDLPCVHLSHRKATSVKFGQEQVENLSVLADSTLYLLDAACQVHYALHFWKLKDLQITPDNVVIWYHYVARM